jgi:hypothetical protein
MIYSSDLLSRQEYEKMINDVKSKSQFEIKKDFKKFNFSLHSSHFSCDGFNFKKGDYFIGFNANKNHGNMAGCGYPITINDFNELFATYQKALDYVCENLSQYVDDEIIRESEQLTLF